MVYVQWILTTHVPKTLILYHALIGSSIARRDSSYSASWTRTQGIIKYVWTLRMLPRRPSWMAGVILITRWWNLVLRKKYTSIYIGSLLPSRLHLIWSLMASHWKFVILPIIWNSQMSFDITNNHRKIKNLKQLLSNTNLNLDSSSAVYNSLGCKSFKIFTQPWIITL